MILPVLLALALQGQGDPMLVTADWLAQHQRDPNLVLLQVGPRPGYDSLHIPGARYIDLREIVVDRPGGPVFELPEPAALDSLLESKGISDDSRIVIYQAAEWYSPATRVYLTLYWAGLGNRVSLLDGGLAGWRARGGAVTAEVPAARRGTLTLRPRDDVVVRADWVASRLSDPRVAVIDARNERFFLARYDSSESNPRPGRIPGAFNIPFPSIVGDSQRVKSPVALREIFLSVRAEPGDTVVMYCHIGQQATLVWFAAKLLGYDARLFDGSFTQWSQLRQYPVERP